MRTCRVFALLLVVTLVGVACGGKGANPIAPTIAVVSVNITGNVMLAAKGQTVQLKALARMTDGSEIDVTATASWTSHNSNVATVSATGLVPAIAPGKCGVDATSSGIKGQTEVEVQGKPEPG